MSFKTRNSSSEHKFVYFGWNLRAFSPCIDSNATDTLKAQKGSSPFKLEYVHNLMHVLHLKIIYV